MINGRDINEFSIESVRSRIGFVSQEPFLFYGTIRDNVAYARDAEESEILNALELAGASEFISQLSNGLDTMVGDRGVMLSGGQRARISLARALLKDPDLLILDEASALSMPKQRSESSNRYSMALVAQRRGLQLQLPIGLLQ